MKLMGCKTNDLFVVVFEFSFNIVYVQVTVEEDAVKVEPVEQLSSETNKLASDTSNNPSTLTSTTTNPPSTSPDTPLSDAAECEMLDSKQSLHQQLGFDPQQEGEEGGGDYSEMIASQDPVAGASGYQQVGSR